MTMPSGVIEELYSGRRVLYRSWLTSFSALRSSLRPFSWLRSSSWQRACERRSSLRPFSWLRSFSSRPASALRSSLRPFSWLRSSSWQRACERRSSLRPFSWLRSFSSRPASVLRSSSGGGLPYSLFLGGGLPGCRFSFRSGFGSSSFLCCGFGPGCCFLLGCCFLYCHTTPPCEEFAPDAMLAPRLLT